ncbi:LuxR C-terminal-related transcriptional regulator [Bradyrhizobium sp. AUGA SZCCT0431]|uniref:helix-turn-helix transcriptional regulator n=1 Tax=Bradyrhizobium sp. AUGA SZCCT0431 TaxID=2807674 RepID=UPI002013136A|nr:LuxR C-terminal-related transcriptional regulator [Bradyrhizobium sp. AUGA SZCCT0431]
MEGLCKRVQVSLARSDLNLNAWIDALRALPIAPVAESDVLAWVEGPLRAFFPFERFLAAYGNLSGGRIQMRQLISSGHSTEFLAGLESRFDLKARGYFAWWVANRKAFVLDRKAPDDADMPKIATRRELDEIERFSLGVVAAHGVIDPYSNAGTYLSFSGVAGSDHKRTIAELDLIAPVLHTLFLLTRPPARAAADLTVLTNRQRELVDLALTGLPDKAIARQLKISEDTVGNHFRAIYEKLAIRKRSQLIALLR